MHPRCPHARSGPRPCSSPVSLTGLVQPSSPHQKVTPRAASPQPLSRPWHHDHCGPHRSPGSLLPQAHRGQRPSRQGPGSELRLRRAPESWGAERASSEGCRERSAALCPLGSQTKLASGINCQARIQLARASHWSVPTPENMTYFYFRKKSINHLRGCRQQHRAELTLVF